MARIAEPTRNTAVSGNTSKGSTCMSSRVCSDIVASLSKLHCATRNSSAAKAQADTTQPDGRRSMPSSSAWRRSGSSRCSQRCISGVNSSTELASAIHSDRISATEGVALN